ncbi:hypothetical protein GTQ43_03610 [Nostoc sp. KVJ3]|uniref:hypothetical protein n=1 Tax=Nostoc sp. KVJ3 TaxID=457945 RepID=UPI0022375E77|nr:hypothetical protein [Nostoc sp. KVJ3]MCW5312968.1 hypothetical protein [Nostoc sp. KVJ3]
MMNTSIFQRFSKATSSSFITLILLSIVAGCSSSPSSTPTQANTGNPQQPTIPTPTTQALASPTPSPTPSPSLVLEQEIVAERGAKISAGIFRGGYANSEKHFEIPGGIGENAGITIDVMSSTDGKTPGSTDDKKPHIYRLIVNNYTGNLVSIEIIGGSQPIEVLRDNQEALKFGELGEASLGSQTSKVKVIVKAVSPGYSKPFQLEGNGKICAISVCVGTSYTPRSIGHPENMEVSLDNRLKHPMKVQINDQTITLSANGLENLNLSKTKSVSGMISLDSL